VGERSARREERDAAGAVRERLAQQGPSGLCDEELVALLLAGARPPSAADVARARGCLAAAGGLGALASALGSPAAGTRATLPIRGAARARLLASLELGRRAAPGPADLVPAIRRPEDAARETRDLVPERREHLVGLYLDAQSRLIARETVAIGSLNVARALPRDLLEPALRHGATGLVVVHNHPSGVAEASEDDVRFTQAVGRGAALLGVALLDHVVVARAGFASLRARGVRWEGLDPPGG
jgi:DNA repair protein RadC